MVGEVVSLWFVQEDVITHPEFTYAICCSVLSIFVCEHAKSTKTKQIVISVWCSGIWIGVCVSWQGRRLKRVTLDRVYHGIGRFATCCEQRVEHLRFVVKILVVDIVLSREGHGSQ